MLRSKRCPFGHGWAKQFSTSSTRRGYESTIENLRIGEHTRVIFQGFTGRQATANAKESIAWGTNIVGGVTPGKTAEHLGLPVLPSVNEAMRQLKPDATGIYVAAHQAAAAIEEAIEAEVPLVVAVAEHIPFHHLLRIHSILNTQSRTRLVGANSPGIISSIGKCRIGFQPLPCFSPGRIGIVAKSGTLSYEAVASTTRAELGQSLCIGMGGDLIAGTNFVDALRIFEHDKDTDGIILIGEIGGSAELEAAAWIEDYNKRTADPKPISALVAGVQASERADPSKRAMGHAGAFSIPTSPTVHEKMRHLQNAGVTMVNHPEKFGGVMKTLLSRNFHTQEFKQGHHQKKTLHTDSAIQRQSRRRNTQTISSSCKRNFYLSNRGGLELCQQPDQPSSSDAQVRRKKLTLAFDRTVRSPTILIQHLPDGQVRGFPFDYQALICDERCSDIVAAARAFSDSPKVATEIENLVVRSFKEVYVKMEALMLEMVIVEDENGWAITDTNFAFDDAVKRSEVQQGMLDRFRETKNEDCAAVEAQKDGIVYVRLAGDGNIGTLVNGAGLAMNTLDALADAGGSATNFLDTGGKATSETVKKSFQIILQDERVKVIFVNIFGGLTLGDMIANGILLAFKELRVSVPVVVRIRGTNEKEGQRIIAESGLPLFAFDDFESAAAKAIELANAEGY